MNPIIPKVIGTLATFASWSVIVFGLTAQIMANYRAKKQLMVTPFLITGTLTYTLWSLYGWTSGDWPLRLAQTPGAILMFIIIWQSWRYKKRKDS